jgi:hypothetical protein
MQFKAHFRLWYVKRADYKTLLFEENNSEVRDSRNMQRTLDCALKIIPKLETAEIRSGLWTVPSIPTHCSTIFCDASLYCN